jgi:hypothetical protein
MNISIKKFVALTPSTDRNGGMTMTQESEQSRDGAAIDLQLALAELRLGRAWTDEERERVRTRIKRTLGLSIALRGVSLTNADEPEIAFAPFRAGDDR